jgi:hypothetical protein
MFKVYTPRLKYQTVQFIYKHRDRGFFKNDGFLDDCFKLIRGFPYFEEQKAKPGETVKAEFVSKEEMNRYLEQLNYTPEEAYKDYSDYIRKIKLEKEIYLKCIDAELAKSDVSEYAKGEMEYFIKDPRSSLIGPFITQLDFLKIFKEFVLNGNEEVLPDYLRVKAYLN